MRAKEFFVRTGIFLPIVIFGMLLLLMLVGFTIDMLGFKTIFYNPVYCKSCFALLTLGALAVIVCQAWACRKNK